MVIVIIKEIMTIKEFCLTYSISRSRYYSEVKGHRLIIKRLGTKKICILKKDADNWMNALETFQPKEST